MTTIENELLPWHQFDYRTDRLGCERFHAFWDWNVIKYSDKEQRCTEEIENRLSNEAPMHVGLPFYSFGPGCSSKMPWKLRCHWLLAGLSSAPVGRLLHSLIGKILKKIPIPAEKWVAPRPSGYPLFDPTVGNNSSAIYPSHSSSLFRIYESSRTGAFEFVFIGYVTNHLENGSDPTLWNVSPAACDSIHQHCQKCSHSLASTFDEFILPKR